MTKELYEEALIDVKKIKEVAEANAQRAVLEAVTPAIRDLIERELLSENVDDVGSLDSAMSLPDDQGKVTLDIDAVSVSSEPRATVVTPGDGAIEYEISAESFKTLKPALGKMSDRSVEKNIASIVKTVKQFGAASKLVRESSGYKEKITQLISSVEDMYEHVQKSIDDMDKKSSYETQLETAFKELNSLQEQKMSKKTQKMINEEDITLKLTGLPDDVDLDSVGVDLITGEDEEGAEGGEGDMGGAEGGEETDLGGDLDLGGAEQGGEGEEDMGESRRLSDDTIVEIDENMLKREIARMRKLREDAVPKVDGFRLGGKDYDDFGGGKDDGEPWMDHKPTTAGKVGEPLGEADDDLDENDDDDLDENDDDMDEASMIQADDDLDETAPPSHMDQSYMDEQDLDQLGQRRKDDDYGHSVADHHTTPRQEMPYAENLKRRLAFESRLQARSKSRASMLKKEAARARAARNGTRLAEVKKEYARVAKRFNESLARSNKFKKMIAESARSSRNGSGTNADSTRSTEVVKSLRNKLAETNLINAKLMFTNKLLQNESLSSYQKSRTIEQFNSAQTVREIKLIFESVSNAFKDTHRAVNENRTRTSTVGSSSRATRPGSAPPQTLNEGYETERWARLAGINK